MIHVDEEVDCIEDVVIENNGAVGGEVSDTRYPHITTAHLKYLTGNYIAIKRVIFNCLESRMVNNILIFGIGFNCELIHEITHGGKLIELEQVSKICNKTLLSIMQLIVLTVI